MRSWRVRPLGPEDASALTGLLASVAAPGPVVDRGPDPFAHPRASGETVHIGAFGEESLVAVAGAVAQMRHVGGSARRSVYLFDVRVIPDFRLTLVLAHVLKALRQALQADDWCHAVVLEGHPLLDRLGRGTPWFGPGQILGRTRHLAWPVFLETKARATRLRIEETDADEAARAYFKIAPGLDLSPADDARFRAEGRYFVSRQRSRVCAVGKLIDEAPRRHILRDASLDGWASALGFVARMRGYPSLPRPGRPVPLSYLSSFASEDAIDPVDFAIAAGAIDRRAAYVCVGRDASVKGPSHPLALGFTSRTYGYGRVPSRLAMRSHELTWM